MKKLKVMLIVFTMLNTVSLWAQSSYESPGWYIGVNGGYRKTFPSFSEIDSNLFPKITDQNSSIFAVYIQGEFGKNRQFAIRPEFTLTKRGGGISNIGINAIDYEDEEIQDIFYNVYSNYVDFRVPLILNFGKPSWGVRPYIYVAPIVGLSTGGKIRLQEEYTNFEYAGYQVDLNQSNYKDFYLAGAAAVGARYSFPLGSSKAFIGLEFMYEYGFTDTYGSKEKKGEAININPMFPQKALVEGSRKYQGMEIKFTFGVPFAAFRRKPTSVEEVVPIVETQPIVVDEVVSVEEEKPCYSLEEIVEMMTSGKNVYGKTICAIDDDINFDFGKSQIKSESYGYLNRLAETLIRTNANIIVKGHTDNVGAEDTNMTLSKNRAENVAKYLIKRGVSESKLSTEYYGMSKPIDTNETEAGRARNRRVEFEIINTY